MHLKFGKSGNHWPSFIFPHSQLKTIKIKDLNLILDSTLHKILDYVTIYLQKHTQVYVLYCSPI